MFRRIIRVPLHETPKELSTMVLGSFWFLTERTTLVLALQTKVDNILCEISNDPNAGDSWIDNLIDGIEMEYGRVIRKHVRDKIMRDDLARNKFMSKEKRLELCFALEDDLKTKVFEHIVDLSYVIGRRVPRNTFSSLTNYDRTECYFTGAKIRRNCIEFSVEER